MVSKRVVAKILVLAALASLALNPGTAVADELPDDGACTGTLVSSTLSTHCCLYNSCFIWEREADVDHRVYSSPDCTQNVHVGSPGGCCDV